MNKKKMRKLKSSDVWQSKPNTSKHGNPHFILLLLFPLHLNVAYTIICILLMKIINKNIKKCIKYNKKRNSQSVSPDQGNFLGPDYVKVPIIIHKLNICILKM